MMDFLIFISANLINILLLILFISRPLKLRRIEYYCGISMIILGIPILFAVAINFNDSREWWTYSLPLFMIVYLIIELFFDYILKLNFRETKLLIPYLIFFYLGLFGMIGYTFLVKKSFGYVTLATYFAQFLATWYSYSKVGHGERKIIQQAR
ncbi:MAG: hypothetical protein V1720_21485 [bacterium]